MGQFLLCAGAAGKRYALTHARIMMHQPSGGVRGQGERHRDPSRANGLHQALDGRTHRLPHRQAVEQVIADSERDRWFTAEQAREYGIIDKVILRRGEME
jgi:ATP-dependent Clp protease protease subunit